MSKLKERCPYRAKKAVRAASYSSPDAAQASFCNAWSTSSDLLGRPNISAAQTAVPATGIDLVLGPSTHVYDGRFANSGWLQETPHPITSHVWGNGALMGAGLAARLGCGDGDAVAVSVDGRSITVPAIVVPGAADDVVRVDLGYGRRQGGSVGAGVGVDARPLLALNCHFSSPLAASRA